jgi:hypothetical protein
MALHKRQNSDLEVQPERDFTRHTTGNRTFRRGLRPATFVTIAGLQQQQRVYLP